MKAEVFSGFAQFAMEGKTGTVREALW